MPRLSWNEIEDRATQFAARWQGETYEKGESQSFWTEFLDVYGIDRRRQGAVFEYSMKTFAGKRGFIDLFWPGKFVAEQKSAGRNLENAAAQANDYVLALPDHDLPQAIAVCDFQSFRVYNLTTRATIEFTLEQLPKHVRTFGFLIDETTKTLAEEDPVNRKAAEGMAELHNRLEANRYTGHDLEVLLVRLVFCMFADDARIFERGSFITFLRRTNVDGTDVGRRLIELFEVLNTPVEQRQTTLDQDLLAFPYINGGLFEDQIRIPAFDSTMRLHLIQATELDWSKVSPAIFGSMFQGVMDETERRNLGAHYTSERNILRVIGPLFLDDLYAEFDSVRNAPRKLDEFHKKLATLNFLDPACGCGNFLVITYRELRRLEHKVVAIKQKGQTALDLRELLNVNVDQMHGIEIEEFPSLIAQTALWLTDHQMNLEASALLGQTYVRLPLTASANIRNVNALTTDWAEVVPPEKLNYILGNPPFNGSRTMTATQKSEIRALATGVREAGFLDFVAGWYLKAAKYLQANPNTQVAFVSTNSISQGEQVAILWDVLLKQGIQIRFAHRTFKWSNEARGVAAVYCVIIGFGLHPPEKRRLFEYSDIRVDPVEITAQNINPYLVDAPDVLVRTQQEPLRDVPGMNFGNMPADGGHLLLTGSEADELLKLEPGAGPYVLPLISAREFLHNERRFCLWLKGIDPSVIRSLSLVYKRVQQVREVRLKSARPKLADVPNLFAQITQEPTEPFILVPRHSSEKRDYIPLGMFGAGNVAHDSCMAVPYAELYHFGVLTSRMHMAWVRSVCGRIKSDYRYSKDIVYNNFPWPEGVTDAQRAEIERLAQAVLDARAQFPNSTLADLYDPNTMPPALTKAHQALDRAVDRLYRSEPFPSDLERVEHLFTRYQQLTGDGAEARSNVAKR